MNNVLIVEYWLIISTGINKIGTIVIFHALLCSLFGAVHGRGWNQNITFLKVECGADKSLDKNIKW